MAVTPPTLITKNDLFTLPPRLQGSNKGTYGRVLIVGGSVGMSGAGYLSAKAAYRAGAGLVEIFAPEENRIIYQTQLPEAVLSLYSVTSPERGKLCDALHRADAIALGMGLSTDITAERLVEWVIYGAPHHIPLLIDADGLNILAKREDLTEALKARRFPSILTPHLKEFSRLSGYSVEQIKKDRLALATSFANEHRVILVLKDAETVITDGESIFLNTAGNQGMSTGGAGDVLTGVIAAFSAFAAKGEASLAAASKNENSLALPHDSCQSNGRTHLTLEASAGKCTSRSISLAQALYRSARLGVLAHALAGDAAAEQFGARGLMASDIAEKLCDVLKSIP